jgi:hypothetical protein
MSVDYFYKSLANKEGLDYDNRCYPGTSNIQVFKYCDEPPSYEIRASFDGIRGLLEELEAPRHFNRVYCLRICSAAMFVDKSDRSFKRFKDYTVEQFGLLIEPDLQKRSGIDAGYTSLKSADYLCLPVYWNESPSYRIQVWRSRVFACPITDIQTTPSKPLGQNLPLVMYLEERWHPYRGKSRSLKWLEHRYRSSKTIEQFRRDTLLILGDVKRGGRQKQIYPDPDKFYQDLRKAYEKVAKRSKKEPSQIEVALEMEQELSLKTFQTRLNDYEISWPLKR